MPLTSISSVPTFVTAAQHAELTSETPQSFSDIPTIIRLEVPNVSVSLVPDFTSEVGTLYILESLLAFMSTSGKGFQIDYPTITLHAVSRVDGNASIYCQLDGGPTEGEGEDDMILAELQIMPSNQNDIEPIFEALSYCAILHPDPQSDEDDADAFLASDTHFQAFNPQDEEQELSQVGRAALEHLESVIDYSNVPGSQSEETKTPTTNGGHSIHLQENKA